VNVESPAIRGEFMVGA